MTEFAAIIFDMDGLLVDSETVWYAVENDVIESRGYVYTDEIREQIIGLRMDVFVEKIRNYYNLSESPTELVKEILDRMLVAIPEKVKAQAGAQELIDHVVAHNIPRAIASSSPMSIIKQTVESQGWEDVFTVRCSADDDEHGKPAPDVYLRAARLLGHDPAQCLALEDSPTGARAAVAAGMTCFAVPDPIHSRAADFNDITPHVYKNLHEVLNRLK